MSAGTGDVKAKISRLQELLERVQLRASAARTGGVAHAAQPAQATPASAVPTSAAQTSPPPAAYNEPELEAVPMTPIPAQAQAPSYHPAAESEPPAAEDYDTSSDGDVEVSSEVVEVDIDIDEPMPLESGAQPVAQQTMPPEDLEEEPEEAPQTTQPSHHPEAHAHEAHEEVAHAAPPANEIEEPTPSSSRRPIAAEEASAEAYEEESAPRHTPPPESGKQVAAAPSNHPPSRKPSAPPPSLEGHTLIGGWREPGLGTPQISPTAGMSTGVRVPAPGPGTEPPATIAQGTGSNLPAAQQSGARLSADVTRPELSSNANVASFAGTPAVESPKTLGELLDLTLSL